MAKDDYFTLVAKVLVYLYARLKGKEKTPPAQYLHPMSKDFPVSEDYFDYVLNEMMEHNYIRLDITKAWGGEIVNKDIDNIQITQEGIEYLKDNSTMRKLVNVIPMASEIYELFQG